MNIVSLLSSTVRISLPLLLATLGILIASKAGISYLAMEGNMMLSAFFGVYGAYLSGSVWIGELCAVLSGITFALIFGTLVIHGRGNQVVCGIGVNFFISGITSVMLSALFKTKSVTPEVARVPVIDVPILGSLSANFFIGIALMILLWFMLEKSVLGLRIRAIGENPSAADSQGIKVYTYQYIALIIVGVFAGLSAAELTLGQLGYFSNGITASRGYIAFSIVVLGGYNPILVFIMSLFVAFLDAFQIRAQSAFDMPTQFFMLLPYLMTIIALLFSKNTKGPVHEGQTYIRE